MSTNSEDTENSWAKWAAAGAELDPAFEEPEEEEAEEGGEAEETEKPAVEKPAETDPQAAAQALLEKRLVELEAQAKPAPETPAEARQEPAKPAIDPAMLAAIKDDFPELYKTFLAQSEALGQMSETVAQLTRREEQRQAQERALIQTAVQAEIEKVPALAHWQKQAPGIFKQGVEIDDLLKKAQPNLSMGERFSKVSAALAAIYGDPVKPSQTNEPEPQEKNKPAQAKPARAISLGDLPSGEAAETGEGALENASAQDLVSSWWGKSEQELEKLWANQRKAAA